MENNNQSALVGYGSLDVFKKMAQGARRANQFINRNC